MPLPMCATRISFVSRLPWPTSLRSETCGGRNDFTEPAADTIERMQSPEQSLAEKAAYLQQDLSRLGRVLIAYSGGVDSAYLAWAAHRVLGDNMLAVIADSASLARTHLADALAFANEQEFPVEVVSTSELDRPEYARNDGQRCFQCKDELFAVMEQLRAARAFDAIAYG